MRRHRKFLIHLFVTLILLAGLLPYPTPASAAISLPPGFVSEVIVTGLAYPTTIAFAPDGRMFIAQKNGRVRIFQNGVLLPTDFIDISAQVNNIWDRGLLGIAVHPNFPTTPYVYFLFAYDPPNLPNTNNFDGPDELGARVSRLIRVSADPNNTNQALPGSEVVLLGTNSTLANIGAVNVDSSGNEPFPPPSCDNNGTPIQDCVPADSPSHSIGTVLFGTDGSLFVGNGDSSSFRGTDARALRALNLDSLAGKILRINPLTGQGYPNNPFYNGDPNSNRSKVWSYGLRNPFRFAIKASTNEPFIGDVGWGSWEEVNTGRGKNFGWPCYEGDDSGSAQQPSYATNTPTQAACAAVYAQGIEAVQAPIYAYNHDAGGASIQAGDFYSGTAYPAKYRGALFIQDYNRDWIKYLTFDGNGNATVHDFATDASPGGGPVQLISGPDTNLYYVVYNGSSNSEIRRLRYSAGGNTPPTAKASASPNNGPRPLRVNFSSAGSFDPDAQPLTYQWNFGDGGASILANPVYTYTVMGTYTAILTVTDSLGAYSTDVEVVTVGNSAPVATITSVSRTTYNVGDVISFNGTATDAEEPGGTLSGSNLKWEVWLHHNEHVHFDYLPENTLGPSGSFTAPDHGDNTWMELCLIAKDNGDETHSEVSKLSDLDCVSLLPNTTTYTFQTVPSGLQLIYDEGVSHTAPFTVTTIVNSQQNISAPQVQASRSFSAWSDGGERSHTITVGPAPQTYTATYINLPPSSVINATPPSGAFPLTVNFSGAASSDPEADPLTYLWNFGDGKPNSTSANPTHVYSNRGAYIVTLTVTDTLGASASASQVIVAGYQTWLPIVSR